MLQQEEDALRFSNRNHHLLHSVRLPTPTPKPPTPPTTPTQNAQKNFRVEIREQQDFDFFLGKKYIILIVEVLCHAKTKVKHNFLQNCMGIVFSLFFG